MKYMHVYEILSATPETNAVPRNIQKSGGLRLSNNIESMKLVEWPVVESTPERAWVL